nr:phytoene/squalene synthase family protein [Cytobacillus gottheilii]
MMNMKKGWYDTVKTSNHLHTEATEVLKETSRTFFIPISLLPEGLKEGVGSAYLCMRAIDEIEDDPEMESSLKIQLLSSISTILKEDDPREQLNELLKPHQNRLPEVTSRISDWVIYCPEGIRKEVLKSTSIMAEGMAKWVEKEWKITNEEELDDYTYTVAGLVGVMLTDIWNWYDGTTADKNLGIAFGRGLQAVNILRNYKEDETRGVSFFPEGWNLDEMFAYAQRNLELADLYIKDIDNTTILHFCKIPLTLAHGTLQALMEGKEKMSRNDVEDAVNKVVGK